MPSCNLSILGLRGLEGTSVSNTPAKHKWGKVVMSSNEVYKLEMQQLEYSK